MSLKRGVSIKAGYRRFTAAYHASYLRVCSVCISKITGNKLVGKETKKERNEAKNSNNYDC